MISSADRERFDRCYTRGPGCWIWTAGTFPRGYGSFGVTVGKRRRHRGAHRVSYLIHHGPIAPGLVVRHRCDNPPCVNPDHLEVGTPADNTADMIERGRNVYQVGSEHHSAKLTEAEAVAIYNRRRSGERGADLAKIFGVSQQVVCDIAKGRLWAHVTGARHGGPKERGVVLL